MHEFRYHCPSSLSEASSIFAKARDPVYLAGGQTLLPVLKQRLSMPSDVIDLGAIEGLSGISITDDIVRIGAMTRHADVASNLLVRTKLPALSDLADHIGDPQVRNMGTLGGSLANSDAAADYPAGILALDARIVTDERTIAADDYFVDLFETALRPGELLTEVQFRPLQEAAYEKMPNPASRYAIVGVMVARARTGIRVAVTGAGSCAFRVPEYEEALTRRFAPESLTSLVSTKDLNEDMHASAEYRAHLVMVLARRAVERIC